MFIVNDSRAVSEAILSESGDMDMLKIKVITWKKNTTIECSSTSHYGRILWFKELKYCAFLLGFIINFSVVCALLTEASSSERQCVPTFSPPWASGAIRTPLPPTNSPVISLLVKKNPSECIPFSPNHFMAIFILIAPQNALHCPHHPQLLC